MTEASQKQEEPIQQQSLLQKPNVVETKVPLLEGMQLPNPRSHSGGRRDKAWRQVISRITVPDSKTLAVVTYNARDVVEH